MAYAISGVVGVMLGLVSGRTALAHTWLALVPWTLVGLGVGWFVGSAGRALRSGAVYGALLPIAFTVAGYQGGPPRPGLYLLLLVVGVIGAACGTVLAWIGHVRFAARGRPRDGGARPSC
jgi:hypothetical protein